MMRHSVSRQRGVAVVTALLLTTLAITIVASLFWQQQVQVRSIENQRLQLQKQWVLRGALDFARFLLRVDARTSQIDHLGEIWATPLADTPLNAYVEKDSAEGGDVPDAALSGSIVDAQSRFNLANLCDPVGNVQPDEVAAFEKLLTQARQNPQLALATADLIKTARARQAAQTQAQQQSQSQSQTQPQSQGQSQSQTQPQSQGQSQTQPQPAPQLQGQSPGQPQPLDIQHVEDLLAVPGFTPEALASIKDFVVVLPKTNTAINVNTAPAEVLAARIATLTYSDAVALVASRKWYNNTAEFMNQPQLQRVQAGSVGKIDVKTEYFLVNGSVRLYRIGMQMQALVQRTGSGNSAKADVVWIRES